MICIVSYIQIMSNFVGGTTDYAILYLYVDSEDTELVNEYTAHIDKHNASILSDPYPNAGFDLICPRDETFNSQNAKLVDYRIKTEMRTYHESKDSWKTTGFYVYPRSSLSKTPLLLANHVGIIDSGYRGELQATFKKTQGLDSIKYKVGERGAQIIILPYPTIYMTEVPELSNTERGTGGFGSTGI